MCPTPTLSMNGTRARSRISRRVPTLRPSSKAAGTGERFRYPRHRRIRRGPLLLMLGSARFQHGILGYSACRASPFTTHSGERRMPPHLSRQPRHRRQPTAVAPENDEATDKSRGRSVPTQVTARLRLFVGPTGLADGLGRRVPFLQRGRLRPGWRFPCFPQRKIRPAGDYSISVGARESHGSKAAKAIITHHPHR